MTDTDRATASAAEQVRLYRPGVLALYFVLGNLPLGMCLYALNRLRRGDRLFGYLLLTGSAVALLGLLAANLAGRNTRPWALLSLLVGLAVMQVETPHYRRALAEGAKPARWWPPLLVLVAFLILFVMFGPD